MANQSKNSTPFGDRIDSELGDAWKQTKKEIEKRRRVLLKQREALGRPFGLSHLRLEVGSDIEVLQDVFVPAVDAVLRSAQRSTGNEITPAFARGELFLRIVILIDDAEAWLRDYYKAILLLRDDGEPYLPKVLECISDEVKALKDHLKARYEIEDVQLEKPTNKRRRKGLTDREQKIWNVIQRGAKGLQYCREVDAAMVSPPRKGIWKEGPRTYVAAYMSGDKRLVHWIQNEKSKIRRKADLAGLTETRTKLASE